MSLCVSINIQGQTQVEQSFVRFGHFKGHIKNIPLEFKFKTTINANVYSCAIEV